MHLRLPMEMIANSSRREELLELNLSQVLDLSVLDLSSLLNSTQSRELRSTHQPPHGQFTTQFQDVSA